MVKLSDDFLSCAVQTITYSPHILFFKNLVKKDKSFGFIKNKMCRDPLLITSKKYKVKMILFESGYLEELLLF